MHLFVAILVAGTTLLEAGDSSGTTNSATRFRFAISSRLFSDVNENDAKAAVKVWARTAVGSRDTPIESEAVFIESTEGFIAAFKAGEIDAASLPSEQFIEIRRQVALSDLFAEKDQADGGDVFLLLVHQESNLRSVADLKGCELQYYDHARASLALPWLDVRLAEQSLPRARDHFAAIARKKKLSAVVLPVFFRTAVACLVPKRSFDTMVEMNPQLGQKLRVVATSQKFVTGICCFRANWNPPNRQQLVDSFLTMDETPAGQQILTVFQSGKLARIPENRMVSVEELIAEHERRFNDNPKAERTAATSISPVNSP